MASRSPKTHVSLRGPAPQTVPSTFFHAGYQSGPGETALGDDSLANHIP